MKNFFVGVKPGVGPVLKIMRDDADDPLTTPNENYGKFLFNSEVQKVGYIRKIIKIEPDFISFPTGANGETYTYLYPSDSSFSNCKAMVRSYAYGGYKWQAWHLFDSYFGLNYYPLVEYRFPIGNTNVFNGPVVNALVGHISARGQVSSFASWAAGIGYSDYYNGTSFEIRPATVFQLSNNPSSDPPYALISVYDLPGLSSAIPDNAGTPTPGQEVIRIDGTDGGLCRIALPGKTVTDSDVENFILHEDKIPAKVLRSGEIDVDQGQTATISCPLPLTAYTYMDYHVKRQTDTEWWTPPYFVGQSESQSLSFTYTVDTDNNEVVITNTASVDLSIRYAICGASEESPTSGGAKILLRGNDGTQDFVQIKRPGSSDSAPNLNDIMIDTRLSYLPILAEGFLSYPGDFPTAVPFAERHKGERKATVTFSNPDGLLPLVKVGSIFEGVGVFQGPPLNNNDPLSFWNRHDVRVTSDPQWSGRASGASVWANIKSTSVDFYSGGQNPYWLTGVDIRSYPSTMLGLRYYIFGLPQSL